MYLTDEKLLKYATYYSVLLMIGVLIVSLIFKSKEGNVTYASELKPTLEITKVLQPTFIPTSTPTVKEEKIDRFSYLSEPVSNQMRQNLGDNFIAIRKPDDLVGGLSFSLEDQAVDRRIIITIPGIKKELIDISDVHRFQGENHHNNRIQQKEPINPHVENTDLLTGAKISYSELDEAGQKNAVITLDLIKTFGYVPYEDEHYFYVQLARPQDIYDKIIVLDAGHGGKDCGTYSRGYEYLEKTMNLDMILKLQQRFIDEQSNIKVYMTRTTDRTLTLNQRVDLANDVEADFFLSIHCNANESRSVKGTEVLYSEYQDGWTKMNSKEFALICLDELVKSIGLVNRGIFQRGFNVHIIGEAKVPVALVEVAFMSNTSDMNFLKKEENRQKAADGIYNGIMRAFNEKEDRE